MGDEEGDEEVFYGEEELGELPREWLPAGVLDSLGDEPGAGGGRYTQTLSGGVTAEGGGEGGHRSHWFSFSSSAPGSVAGSSRGGNGETSGTATASGPSLTRRHLEGVAASVRDFT
jgi:hypothetical protein